MKKRMERIMSSGGDDEINTIQQLEEKLEMLETFAFAANRKRKPFIHDEGYQILWKDSVARKIRSKKMNAEVLDYWIDIQDVKRDEWCANLKKLLTEVQEYRDKYGLDKGSGLTR